MTKVSRTTRIKSGMIATILAFALSIAVIVILGNNLEKHDINDHMEEQQQHRRLANKRTTTYVDTDLNDEPISNLRSVGDYPVVATDKPFFWWAPLAGCPDASDIIKKCGLSKDVDTSTREGIQEFLDKKLASDETVDMIVSPYFKEAAGVFNSDYQGRAFTFIRDPIKRELAHFHYLQKMEKTDKNYNIAVAGMALEGYVNSDYANNNWLTRHLIGKEKGVLSEENLEMAKAILREKVLVLLVDDVHEHISYRLRMYFGSSGIDMGGKWDCISKMVHDHYEDFEFPMIAKKTHEYSMLSRNNNFDLRLFHYARYLYEHQKSTISRKSDEHKQKLLLTNEQQEETTVDSVTDAPLDDSAANDVSLDEDI
mmetsp:Transcript_61231/g.73647  ORF Transcript_61231/g.73647 Transcript_61231/m.73647 type:complete len:369 (-) Transcript_61231:20-1126(-)